MVKHASESTTSHLPISLKEHLYFGCTSDDWQLHETPEKRVFVTEERFPVVP